MPEAIETSPPVQSPLAAVITMDKAEDDIASGSERELSAHAVECVAATRHRKIEKKHHDDTHIDQLIWQAIVGSECAEDFRCYLRHAPESASHLEEALDRLIALEDAAASGESRYPEAIAAIRERAEAGNPAAQFHMGRIHTLGLGVKADVTAASVWYCLAILQGESRSMVNLSVLQERQGNLPEAIRLARLAIEQGDPFGLINLGRQSWTDEETHSAPATTMESYLAAWEAGEPAGAYMIGTTLLKTDESETGIELAMQWLERAALADSRDACQRLGAIHEFGWHGHEENHARALEWFRRGALMGDVKCQQRLGIIALAGDQLPHDGAEAVKWLKMAAVQEDRNAQRALGIAYTEGIEVIKNIRFGRKWLERAARAGDADSCLRLARMLKSGEGEPADPAAAFHWLEQAARLGLAQAQAELGQCHVRGDGTAKDVHAGFKWINLAAVQGDPHGLYLLGGAYESGIGVEANLDKAIARYRQAAELGHRHAQRMLGRCYLGGHGVEADIAEAVVWLSRAVENGDAGAARIVGRMFLDGVGVEPNPVEGSQWLLNAAENGDAEAQYELGKLYETGIGLARNPSEARAWIEKAAAQDFEKAREWVERHAQLELIMSPSGE